MNNININNSTLVRCCYCREDGHSITECNHSSINILRVNIRKKYIKKISENIIYNIYNENNNYNYLLSQLSKRQLIVLSLLFTNTVDNRLTKNEYINKNTSGSKNKELLLDIINSKIKRTDMSKCIR